MSKEYLIDVDTGEIRGDRVYRERIIYPPIISRSDIEKCNSREELAVLLKHYRRYSLCPPVDFNTILTKGEYKALMELCRSIVGLSYTYVTMDDLKVMWGCKEAHAYQLMREFIKGGIIHIIHRNWGYLIQINPWYGWRNKDEWHRWLATRTFLRDRIREDSRRELI